MKKFTLLILVMLLGITGVDAKQTVVYKNVCTTGEWTQGLMLDKDLFANVKTGDILYLKWELDQESAIAKDGEGKDYYQFNISFPYGSWEDKLVGNTDVKYTAPHHLITLTEAQVTKLKTYGIGISARFLKIKDVVYGDPYGSTEVKYWNNDKWSSAKTDNFIMDGGWPSCTLDGEIIKSAKKGDRLTITFKDSGVSLWDSQLQFINGTGWVTLQGIPVGGLTKASLLIDENIYTAFSGGDIRLCGTNLTVTDIQLETTSLYYSLNANNNNVDITKLPISELVNIDLTRRYDYNTTLCLPYDVENVQDAFGSTAKAYEFTSASEDKLTFTERESITAGKPYFMEFGEGDKDKTTISFENVTINTAPNNSAESNGLTFKGNYTPAMNMEGKYGVACVQVDEDWVWGFYKGGSGSNLNAFSAYFDGTYALKARLAIRTVDSITGVEEVKGVEEQRQGDNIYYNLSGQRVVNPSNGIYILNGKKVIVK